MTLSIELINRRDSLWVIKSKGIDVGQLLGKHPDIKGHWG